MSGALLRSGSLREFFALGAVGYPVYQSATQLRVAMRSQIGVEVADTFAIPKRNESGDRIDWYAPFDGLVVPWTSATEDERAGALQALQAMRERVLSAGQRLQAESDSERQVFGRLLQHVMTFPDDQHVYLVDGKPVLTFWGFRRHDAPGVVDSLALLAASEKKVAPVNVEPAAAIETAQGRRWPWWLWLLLLLLLLIPLLFWYRSCSELPTLGSPIIEPTKPSAQLPDKTPKPVEPHLIDGARQPVEVLPGAPTTAVEPAADKQPVTEETAPSQPLPKSLQPRLRPRRSSHRQNRRRRNHQPNRRRMSHLYLRNQRHRQARRSHRFHRHRRCRRLGKSHPLMRLRCRFRPRPCSRVAPIFSTGAGTPTPD